MDRSGFLRLFCLLDGDENRNYLRAYTLYIACTSNDNTVHLLLTPRLRLRSPTITILSYAARILQLASNDTLSSLSCSSRALVLPQLILPFFRVLASVLDNSSSRPLGQRSSFPAYQFLTTDWFSRKYSSLMNTVSFHSFLNRMSVFCIGSRCLSLEPAFPTFFSPPTSLAASSFILPSLREIILPNLLAFINDAV